MKGKILQLALYEEVSPDASSAKRSQTTGHLVVTMPKLQWTLSNKINTKKNNNKNINGVSKEISREKSEKNCEKLEVSAQGEKPVDIYNIVKHTDDRDETIKKPIVFSGKRTLKTQQVAKDQGEDFTDDEEVPPLE